MTASALMMAVVLMIFSFTSCGKTNEDSPLNTNEGDKVITDKIVLCDESQQKINFGPTTSETTLKFFSQNNWKVSGHESADWLKLSVSEGDGGDNIIKFTTETNKTYYERAVAIRITSGSAQRTIRIYQVGRERPKLAKEIMRTVVSLGGELDCEFIDEICLKVFIKPDTAVIEKECPSLLAKMSTPLCDRNDNILPVSRGKTLGGEWFDFCYKVNMTKVGRDAFREMEVRTTVPCKEFLVQLFLLTKRRDRCFYITPRIQVWHDINYENKLFPSMGYVKDGNAPHMDPWQGRKHIFYSSDKIPGAGEKGGYIDARFNYKKYSKFVFYDACDWDGGTGWFPDWDDDSRPY